MHRFQLIFWGGLTQNLMADRYSQEAEDVVFYVNTLEVARYERRHVLMIESIDEGGLELAQEVC